MAKIALYKIGFTHQNDAIDDWYLVQPVNNEVTTYFDSIDQSSATLEETLSNDGNGLVFQTSINFTLRRQSDINTAKSLLRKPIILKAVGADEHLYTIGSKDFPVRLTATNIYDGMNTREMRLSAEYFSLTGILSR